MGGLSPSSPPPLLFCACHFCQHLLEVNDSSEAKSAADLIILRGPVGGLSA